MWEAAIARFIALLCFVLLAAPALAEPETVTFKSDDNTTLLVGYLFRPSGAGPHPAVVLLHGRAGPYSANNNSECTTVAPRVRSPCNATTLSKRHAMWGQFWADHGYVALLPDSFGPRGKARGFGRFSHGNAERDDVNERTVRPLDAEAALAYLGKRSDISRNRIFLQGWSNGGSTALNVMIRQGTEPGFHAALVFYPGCGKSAMLESTVPATAPITILLAEDDEEVSPEFCQQLVERSRDTGAPIKLVVYPGASHDFDDPGERRQAVSANRKAKADAMTRALAIFEAGKN